MKKKTILLGSVAIMFLAACALNSGVSSEQIGLRKASLENENKVALVDASFTALQPGESVLLSVLLKMHHRLFRILLRICCLLLRIITPALVAMIKQLQPMLAQLLFLRVIIMILELIKPQEMRSVIRALIVPNVMFHKVMQNL